MNGGERYDGKAGESYVRPASNRHGMQDAPGWRDPDWSRENWRYCGRMIGRYVVCLLIASLLLGLWLNGYAVGRDGEKTRCKESNNGGSFQQ